jgi:cell surface protein SprA
MNMDMLYKYLGLTKTQIKPKPKVAAPKPGWKIVNTNSNQVPKNSEFVDGFIGVLTSIKNIQMNYTHNSGTVLPGYTPGVGFLGHQDHR